MEEQGQFVITAKRYVPENGFEVLKPCYLIDTTKFTWGTLNQAKVWPRYSDVLRYVRALPADLVDSKLHNAGIKQLSLTDDGCYALIEKEQGLDKKFIARMERYRDYSRKRNLFLDAQNAAYEDFRITHSKFTKESLNEFKDHFGCAFCGNRTELQFHHIRRAKRIKQAVSAIRSWEDLENELKIGIILCRPCHVDLHRRFRYHTSESEDESGDIL